MVSHPGSSAGGRDSIDLPLAEEGRTARRTGAQAWQGLALSEAAVRLGTRGPSDEGVLRIRWLDGGPHGPPVLPAGRRGKPQEGSGAPPDVSLTSPISEHQTLYFCKFNGANGIRTRDLLLAKQALSQLSYGPALGVPSRITVPAERRCGPVRRAARLPDTGENRLPGVNQAISVPSSPQAINVP